MERPALAPRNAYIGVGVVWVVALLAAVGLGIFLPEDLRVNWLLIAFGGVVLLSFIVQLGYGRVEGFLVRTAASVGGALLVMALISAGFGLAALAPEI